MNGIPACTYTEGIVSGEVTSAIIDMQVALGCNCNDPELECHLQGREQKRWDEDIAALAATSFLVPLKYLSAYSIKEVAQKCIELRVVDELKRFVSEAQR